MVVAFLVAAFLVAVAVEVTVAVLGQQYHARLLPSQRQHQPCVTNTELSHFQEHTNPDMLLAAAVEGASAVVLY